MTPIELMRPAAHAGLTRGVRGSIGPRVGEMGLRIDDVTRRELLAVTVVAALFAACRDCEDTSSGDSTDTSWSFTDDRGKTVSLASRPQRVIAQEDAAAALWPFTIRPIAVFGNAPLSDNPQFAGEDISAIQSVGEVFGEVDIEKMAALDPDLIVTPLWPQQEATSGGVVAEFERRVAPIAPLVAIDASKPFRRMISRYQDLAASLGVDLGAPAVAEAGNRLDAAFAALAAAAKDANGLRLLAVSASTDQLYIADPSQYSDLQEYQAAGLEFVVPENTSDSGGLWEALSWEQANKYHADVVIYDNRPPGTVLPTLEGSPTWGTLPAVKGGQIGPWYVGTTYRLSFFSQQVEELSDLIRRSRRVG